MIPEDKLDLIIEILRQHDKQFDGFRDEVNRRFEQIDKQFSDFRSDVDRRFTEVNRQLEEMRELIREDRH